MDIAYRTSAAAPWRRALPIVLSAILVLTLAVPAAAGFKKIKLSVHERQGGHTIERHVGKSDQELIDRLAKQKKISAASTFPGRSAAERAVTATLNANEKKVRVWMKTAGRGERLVIQGKGKGRGISRKHFNQAMKAQDREAALQAAVGDRSRTRVVLEANGKGGFHVLTAYPE